MEDFEGEGQGQPVAKPTMDYLQVSGTFFAKIQEMGLDDFWEGGLLRKYV
jgi:hypothetical protein